MAPRATALRATKPPAPPPVYGPQQQAQRGDRRGQAQRGWRAESANQPRRKGAEGDEAERRKRGQPTAAGLAAERRTAEDLDLIDRALIARDDAWQCGDAAAFVDADTEFHLVVVAASHNPVLRDLFADMVEVVRDFLRADVGPALRGGAAVDHAGLVEAIRAGDSQAAAAEAGRHAFVWEHSWSEPASTREGRPVETGRPSYVER